MARLKTPTPRTRPTGTGTDAYVARRHRPQPLLRRHRTCCTSIDLDIRPGRVRRAARPQRLRQVDAAAQPGRPRPVTGRRGRGRRPHRRRLPGAAAAAVAAGPRERRARAARTRPSAAPRGSSWPSRRSRRSGSPTSSTPGRCQLSGGQAQRVSLARALVSKPDAAAARRAVQRARRADPHRDAPARRSSCGAATRMAVLLVTHDVDEALALADRVVVMDEGRARPQLADQPAPPDRAHRPQPEIARARAEILDALGVKPTAAQPEPQATRPTKEQHEHRSARPHPRRRSATVAGLLAAALLLAGCGGAATGNEGAVNDDGIGRPRAR